jgi:hypothetical protein
VAVKLIGRFEYLEKWKCGNFHIWRFENVEFEDLDIGIWIFGEGLIIIVESHLKLFAQLSSVIYHL